MMQKKYRNRLIVFVALLPMMAGQAEAISKQKMTDEEFEALQEVWKPLEVSGDAIAWDVFAETGEKEFCLPDNAEFDYCVTKPEYGEKIKALDGKEVTLMGFMFPLDQTEKQRQFLLGPYPLSCPFHYHVGPLQVVEVLMKEGVEFSYDPVVVKGVLKLRFNEDTNMFYYLENAVAK